MRTYQYTAKDRNGQAVNGILDGESDSEIAEILHKKDLIVFSIKEANSKAVKSGKDGNVKLDDLVIFSRQLATLIDAGVPLVQTLSILSDQIDSKNLRIVVMKMHREIEAGTSFSDTVAKHPNVFSEIFINMTRAGEASGMLNEVLDRLATYFERSASLNRKIRSSFVYPTVVITMAVLITIFLLVKVVPTFKNIFDTLGGELPLPTQVLIGISNLFKKYFILTSGFFFIAAFALKKYINTVKGRYIYDGIKLKLPVLGPLFRKVALARFSRTFATLVKSGVSIMNALDIVARTSGNKVLEETVINSRNAVRNGESFSKNLAISGVFPPMVCRMINIGEQTGQLENMLSKIADFYDEQVDAAIASLTSMIEPMVIAFLGVIIGGIVISLFLPIFKITELISR